MRLLPIIITTITALLPLFVTAQKKGSSGGGGDTQNDSDDSNSPLQPGTSTYGNLHTYTYPAVYSTFLPSPICSLSRATSTGTTSAEVSVLATSDADAADKFEEIYKTRAFPTPVQSVVPIVGEYPAWATDLAASVTGACTAVVTGARFAGTGSTGGSSSAARGSEAVSGRLGWVFGGFAILVGALMVRL